MDVAVATIAGNGGGLDGPWPLPKGWAWAKLGNLLSHLTSGSRDWAEYYDRGSKVFIMAQNVRSGRYNHSYTKYVDPPEHLKDVERSRVQRDDLLVTIVGANTGDVCRIDFDAKDYFVCQSVALMRPILPQLSAYLEMYLIAPDGGRGQMNKVIYGAGRPHLSFDQIESFAIPLPPLAEQSRIVARVDALFAEIDEGMAALAAARKGLDTFRRALLKAAVTGELTKDWRAENPAIESGHDLLARIDNKRPTKGRGRRKMSTQPIDISVLPTLPQGWAWARPSEIQADIDNALTIGPFGSNLKVSDYRESGVPLIFVRHIRSEDFRGGGPKFVTAKKARELASHTARAGDILITKMGDPPGDACRYPDDAPDAIITADCIKWTIHDQVCFPEFYVHFINSAAGRSQILEMTTGVAQQKVSLDRFRQIIVPVPPPAEAAEILRRVSEALAVGTDMLAMLNAEATDVARLKQSILKAALEGRVVPQDSAEEPVSALLARLADSPSGASRGRARKSDA